MARKWKLGKKKEKEGERNVCLMVVNGGGGFHNCSDTKNSWGSRRGGTLVNGSTKIQEGKMRSQSGGPSHLENRVTPPED